LLTLTVAGKTRGIGWQIRQKAPLWATFESLPKVRNQRQVYPNFSAQIYNPTVIRRSIQTADVVRQRNFEPLGRAAGDCLPPELHCATGVAKISDRFAIGGPSQRRGIATAAFSLTAGSHTITATYGGDGNSASITQMMGL